jgi:hypothetical protein
MKSGLQLKNMDFLRSMLLQAHKSPFLPVLQQKSNAGQQKKSIRLSTTR